MGKPMVRGPLSRCVVETVTIVICVIHDRAVSAEKRLGGIKSIKQREAVHTIAPDVR